MNVKLIEPTKQEIAEDLHQLMLMISIDDEKSCFPKFKLFILKCLKLRLLQNNVLERQSQRRSGEYFGWAANIKQWSTIATCRWNAELKYVGTEVKAWGKITTFVKTTFFLFL